MNKIIDLCLYELEEANKEFPPFHSAHEGYAVLLEELEETVEAFDRVQYGIERIWSYIKRDDDSYALSLPDMKVRAYELIAETVQIGAMLTKLEDFAKMS